MNNGTYLPLEFMEEQCTQEEWKARIDLPHATG